MGVHAMLDFIFNTYNWLTYQSIINHISFYKVEKDHMVQIASFNHNLSFWIRFERFIVVELTVFSSESDLSNYMSSNDL